MRSIYLLLPVESLQVAALSATSAAAGERFVHDAADGACAPPALGAAAEATIDFARGTRGSIIVRQRRAHVMIGEHVARADDHCEKPGRTLVSIATIDLGRTFGDCNQKLLFELILSYSRKNISFYAAAAPFGAWLKTT